MTSYCLIACDFIEQTCNENTKVVVRCCSPGGSSQYKRGSSSHTEYGLCIKQGDGTNLSSLD